MPSFYRWTAASACMVLLAGCSSFTNPMSVDQAGARSAANHGTPFQSALHQEYSDLTSIEWTEADYGNARYFADRARSAAAGQAFGPTEVGARKIKAGRVDEANAMRNRVMAILDGDAPTRVPQSAAHLQAMFDCWLEEVDETNQPADEASCLNEMNAMMAQLAVPRAAAPAPAPVAAAPATPARSFQIFFDFDKFNITDAARSTVDAISTQIKQQNPRSVTISGNADRSGSDGYNMKLSQRRSDSVATMLSAEGAKRSTFKIEAFGESRPLVQTADGVREPQNRRVEVTLE